LHRDGDVAISLVAMEGDDVIGHVVFSRMTAPFPAIGLAPISVSPNDQGRGIGSMMIEAGLKRAATESWEAVFVLGDPGFYGRFGFDASLAKGFTSPYAGPYLMVKPVGGPLSTMSGHVDYAPAFSKFSA
jgi:putative acetyltransferase